jgi:hypothetical protein
MGPLEDEALNVRPVRVAAFISLLKLAVIPDDVAIEVPPLAGIVDVTEREFPPPVPFVAFPFPPHPTATKTAATSSTKLQFINLFFKCFPFADPVGSKRCSYGSPDHPLGSVYRIGANLYGAI